MSLVNKLLAVALAVGAPLSAQILTGPGRETAPTLPAETIVNSSGCLGVAYLNGKIYVSARGNAGGTAPPHSMYEIDVATGTLLNSWQQGTGAGASAWGYRDGTTDGASLAFGADGGLDFFDTAGTPVTTWIATNGPQAVASPLPMPGGTTSLWRGLAYDPNGNGGNGSFFTGSFATSIFEIDLNGTLIRTFPNAGFSTYGLALDPSGTTLWVYSTPSQGLITEYLIDRPNLVLTPTGRSFDDPFGAAAQGGLSLVPRGVEGRNCGYDLVALTQTTPDSVSFHRLDLWDNFSSMNEWPLVTGVDNAARDGSAKTVSLSGNTSVEMELLAPRGTGYVMFFEFGSLTPRPVGPMFGFPSVWEYRLSNLNFSVGYDSALPAFSLLTALIPATFGGDVSIQAVAADLAGLAGSIVPCRLQLPLQVSNVCTLTFTR